TPFSLDDLDGERSAPKPQTSPTPQPAPAADEPTMTPFSFSDLGLSDDEIAGLENVTEPPAAANVAAPHAPPTEPDEPTMTPFSLSDLGLSDDEIAGLDSLGMGSATPERPNTGRAGPSSTPPGQPRSAMPSADEDAFDTSGLPMDLQPFS